MKIVKWVGSIYFALFLLAALVLILTVSTLLESHLGTPFAQTFFYQAGWFDFFLALFGANIACSTLTRWPFKKHHTGFVITHIGILILLVGSLLTRWYGSEGQMPLNENETGSRIIQTQNELVAHGAGGKHAQIELHGFTARIRPQEISVGDTRLRILRVVDNAHTHEHLTEGGKNAPLNRALRLTLKSDILAFHQTFSLMERHPANPHSRKISIGMATLELKDKKTPAMTAAPSGGPTLGFMHEAMDAPLWIALDKNIPEKIALGRSGYTVSDVHYYSDARVGEKNKLINVSDQPQNPAVEFNVSSKNGEPAHFVRFALFPDFESMHAGQAAGKTPGLHFEFQAPGAAASAKPKGASLTVHPGKPWGYESINSKGAKLEGELEKGKSYATGWMDFSFVPEEFYERAVVETKIEPRADKGEIAVEVEAAVVDGNPIRKWIMREPEKLETDGGPIVVEVRPKNLKVPFLLTLKDFRKVDYPGTRNAASYESDVLLEDPVDKIKIERTISMNKPLDYKGWRIFQSSFIQEETREVSVFTFSKNPGIGLIYGGACVLFLGAFIVFYVKPLSSKN